MNRIGTDWKLEIFWTGVGGGNIKKKIGSNKNKPKRKKMIQRKIGAAGQQREKTNVFSISNYSRLINSSSMEHWGPADSFESHPERREENINQALKCYTCPLGGLQ